MDPYDRAGRRKGGPVITAEGQRESSPRDEAKAPLHDVMSEMPAAQGDGFGTTQPNLANFPRAFWKNAEYFRRITDDRIVKSIERGLAGTSMPPYGELLGHEAVNSLVDLIFREFMRIKRDDKRGDLTAPPKPAVILSPEKTEKVYTKHCSSCHGVAGTGKGPEYLKYLPRPRDLTNRPYFRARSDEKIALTIFYGVSGTGMSPFSGKISGETVWSLVIKIRELSGSPPTLSLPLEGGGQGGGGK